MILTDGAYVTAQALVAARLGLSFPESRRADLERGLAGALRAVRTRALEPYLARLAAAPTTTRSGTGSPPTSPSARPTSSATPPRSRRSSGTCSPR